MKIIYYLSIFNFILAIKYFHINKIICLCDMLRRYHRNLSAKTLIFVGTIPLAVYHAPSAPPPDMAGDYPTKPPVGFVVPSANTALPPLPEPHLYPNLRKIENTVNNFVDLVAVLS